MKFKHIFYAIIFLVILVVIVYTLQSTKQNKKAYIEEVKQERIEKNRFMKNSAESPFKGEEKEQFTELKYFEPDLTYKVMAALEPINQEEYLILPTSSGQKKKFLKYAFADFTLMGVNHRLLLLKGTEPNNKDKVFLPFADETSGDETYGAGRYIDLEIKNKTRAVIDFNKAYNPYCNYSDEYNCPLPPRENILDIAIKAGEKTYEK